VIRLAEDDAVHLVKLIVGPIVRDGLHHEAGPDEFSYQDVLRYAVSDPVFGNTLGIIDPFDGSSSITANRPPGFTDRVSQGLRIELRAVDLPC